ncbi:MAG: endolytic transglycosylase MltG [Alphaproteobacteria bacterium]|nr:endolytic transglycosylase MltG [Alphaproteobacteria bacterium]
MRILLATVSCCILAFVAILIQPSKLPDHSVFFTKDDSLYETLKKDGSFRNVILYKIVDNISSIKNNIKTGEYMLNNNDNTFTFLKKMIDNKSITRKITFPEGWTVYKIIQKLNDNEILSGNINELPEEGSLMPDTYFYKFGDSKLNILNKMKDQMILMRKKIKQQNRTNLNTNEIITLASIIEKEVHKDNDRKIVSSIYHNRLKKKMKLQADPTVVYALTKNDIYQGKISTKRITHNDLSVDSKYNTYKYTGLPPTPICCPSRASIIAAMQPAKTDYLYFVSDMKNDKNYYSNDFQPHIKYKNMVKANNSSI